MRPIATLVVLRLVVPTPMVTEPSEPVPVGFAIVQVVPVQLGGHVQVKLLTPSVQAPPFWQGFGAQSLMFVPQVTPL